ncbi:putative pentatricopeptide repeat-containing protein At3g49142 [Selaginella moellendorffii]|uniref:putative pentatricopeptide repeat-containing protein At3g49142 n=1 Tax=Selaginella moellendorffii TaxID=88036 RepID=UPI000D1C7D6B|nr:putative pentatricopeptide repeat-containing protein At3g49142 [Selaginella moellendorffii]|eukprot:XP_024536019.1 putative pentatricopeptide repeat-containing protein At3g49142 [Selaginella moellendorffii]
MVKRNHVDDAETSRRANREEETPARDASEGAEAESEEDEPNAAALQRTAHEVEIENLSHSQSDEIAVKLKQLLLRMKEEGYASDMINILKDIPKEEKEDHLCSHSEKLALRCALVNSHQKETIRIVKNL